MKSATNTTSDPATDTPWQRDATVIGLVSAAHFISHFNQLLLAPLFPWLKEAFAVSYTELGFVMTVFFTVSCAVQALCGFWVDRYGPRPVLFAGLALLALACLGYALSTSYAALLACAVVAGVGNGVFHPVDYTLINRKVSAARLGHAYSAHGICGSLGWALAPVGMVTLAQTLSWRWALGAGAALSLLVLLVLLVLWQARERIALAPTPAPASVTAAQAAQPASGSLDFLRIPVVWVCFVFFFFYASSLSVVQSFATEAARQLHAVPELWMGWCLTIYMLCSAAGVVAGGFLARDPARCEKVVATGFGAAACGALVLGFGDLAAPAVPLLFGLMGMAAGLAGPSRDLLVKKSTPQHASGRVYGVVYSGLDIGQALTPLAFGVLMDKHHYQGVWLGLVLVQALLVFSAFRVTRTRRSLVGVKL